MLQTPNEFNLMPTKCHICYQEIREDQHAIEHSGHMMLTQSKDPRFANLHDAVDGYGAVWFHPECATVMALRLASDVMRVKHVQDQPSRVVDSLQAIAKVNLVR
jgi:hypothetical protein